MPGDTCTHIDAVDTVKPPQRHECEDCVKIGSRWVHLRTCQTCAAHAAATTRRIGMRPNMRTRRAIRDFSRLQNAANAGSNCYPDDAFAEY
jgi:hypothetical protein